MKNKYPWKQAIITGLIVGTFAICSFSIADALNKQFAWGINPAVIRGICGLLTLIILATGIYTGMQSVKRLNSGSLTYGQAIVAGIVIAVTTGIITAFLGFIYCEYINPGYAAYMVAEGKKAMIAEGQDAATMAANITNLQKEFSTPMQVFQAIVGQSVFGTVISLIMALFVRTKK